jgi:uncharacterized protein (TIGR02452 family)
MSNRARKAEIARETLAILEAGGYTTAEGRRVDLAEDLHRAVAATSLYRPDDFPRHPAPTSDSPRRDSTIEVTEETTLQAAARLADEYGIEPMCLNFASAKNPGGGFLNGAQAQEESLARSSGLYSCLMVAPGYYEHHRAHRTPLYSDHMIFSPGVPVFHDDDGRLLDSPYRAAFLTSPAVNAGVLSRDHPDPGPLIASTMRARLAKVLWLAHRHGQTHLVLGAWGCGVFGNGSEVIAGLFREALAPGGLFAGVFPHVVFAIYDRSPSQGIYRDFHDALSSLG